MRHFGLVRCVLGALPRAGNLTVDTADYARAAPQLDDSLQIRLRLGRPDRIAGTVLFCAKCVQRLGYPAQAVTLFAAGLQALQTDFVTYFGGPDAAACAASPLPRRRPPCPRPSARSPWPRGAACRWGRRPAWRARPSTCRRARTARRPPSCRSLALASCACCARAGSMARPARCCCTYYTTTARARPRSARRSGPRPPSASCGKTFAWPSTT